MNKATIKRMGSLIMVAIFTVCFAANSSAQYTLYGDEVIIDGTFEGDSISSAWSPFINEDGGASATIANVNGEASITDISGTNGNDAWFIQFNQILTDKQIASLREGANYELTFNARTDVDSTKSLVVFFGQNGGGWVNYAEGVELTGEMTTFTQEFEVSEVWDNTAEGMKLGFEAGLSDASVYLDSVSLKMKSDNIVFNGDFALGDSSWTLSPGAASIEVVNEELAFTDIPGEGDTFSVQAMHIFGEESLDSLYAGPYQVSFDARTSEETQEVHLYFGERGGSWARYFGESSDGRITVDTTMKTYNLEAAIETVYDVMQIGFEVNYAPGDFYVDNIIVTRINDVAPAAPTFSLSTNDDGIVTISVNEVEGAATYDVYYADSAFTDRDGGKLIGTIDTENGNTFEHTTAAPHPSVAYEFTAHYGVIAKSEKGTPSDMTSNSIETPMSAAENYAYELSAEAENALLQAFNTGEIPEGSALASFFPATYSPFTIDGSTSTEVAGSGPVEPSDHSSRFWVGFRTQSQVGGDMLVIYNEVIDDSVVFATEADGSGGAWNFDSYEIGIGNYSPDPWIKGSQHTTHQGGEEPDWQLRGGGIVDAAGDGTERGFIHAYGLPDGTRINGEVPNSQTLLERTDDGFRVLTIMITANLATANEKVFDFPTGEEVDLYPFQISTNDNDATTRESQFLWGTAAEDGGWWSDPSQWNMVAFVGADAVVTSNEEQIDKPLEYSLEQNYPNPFNPTTNISFTLPKADKVTLEVFNLLGQKVATLINNESLTAGSHSQTFDASNLSSGLYFYRINVGSSYISSKKMMLIK
jgi:hypothetical protein